MTQRRVSGTIVFPANAQPMVRARVIIEVRDISVQDAPAALIAQRELEPLAVQPGLALPFELQAPEVDTSRSLCVRVQVERATSRGASAPVLLTTAIWPVPARGEASQLQILLQQL